MRITKRDREILRGLRDEYIDLKYNHARRLRNALLALASADPRWMAWVEREVDPRWSLERQMRLVEARARTLFAQGYVDLRRSSIYFNDTPFSDRGSLLPG